MSLEHSHAMSEIRPDVMNAPDHHTAVLAALHRYEKARAAFDFLHDHAGDKIDLQRYRRWCHDIYLKLIALRAININGALDHDAIALTKEECAELEATYAAEYAHWQAETPLKRPKDLVTNTIKSRCDLCNRLEREIDSLGRILHWKIVGEQAAWIEWQHGRGAEAAMMWIHNGLCGPGHLPDEDEPHGKQAQAWFDTHCPDIFGPVPVPKPLT